MACPEQLTTSKNIDPRQKNGVNLKLNLKILLILNKIDTKYNYLTELQCTKA